MSTRKLMPNLNMTASSMLDTLSIQFLKRIFPVRLVDSRQLQEGGTLPNIDGYIEILCPDGSAEGKIVVQVKHLTYSEKNGRVFYDIPESIYAYAERHKGEVVIFIACDSERKLFYWRSIDAASIEDFMKSSDHIRTKARYYFKEHERCSKENVVETIGIWSKLYEQKMDSIKDDRMLADQFASQQRMCFNYISSELHGTKDSHICRHQVVEIAEWINNATSSSGEKDICLLVGEAGVGKSAILKDLVSCYRSEEIKFLCIKADYIDDTGNHVTLEKLYDTLAFFSSEVEKVILIIDQIDALSQSLSNDRKYLNMMMTVLSSLDNWPNVKAVVSCRKYDLEYDSVLNSLKEKSTIIEVGELTETEVVDALNKLEDGLGEKVDNVTCKILRTVQTLNSFAILFHRNGSIIKFNNQIELYDALWNNIICDSSTQKEVEIRESVMYKIATTINVEGTQNPLFTPISKQRRAFEYIASNGLIRRKGRAVSFFHQSFYEYTLARFYSENNRLFTIDLKNRIQGLEVRSIVKAVLDFKRGHDVVMFIEEARSILFDQDMRLHLKLLTLSVLAFIDEPSLGEKRLVVESCRQDIKLLEYFLRGVNSQEWFGTVCEILSGRMVMLQKNDRMFYTIMSCLSRFAFRNSEKVYDMINRIHEQETRKLALANVLRGHNDYNKKCVLKAYEDSNTQNIFWVVNLIEDALKSNNKFALNQAEKLILNYLLQEHSNSDSDGYELVEELCPKICVEYPIEMLGILHRCICNVIRETALNRIDTFTISKKLVSLNIGEYDKKLLKMYEDLMTRLSFDENIVRPFIHELLSLNNETTLSIAFMSLTAAPRLYDDLICSFIVDYKTIESYLHGDVEFFFLKMLRTWYDTLNEVDAERYQKLLLSFKSEYDSIYVSERQEGRLLCPQLWLNKWKLICNTLPENSLIPEMKKCSQELLRRFGIKIMVDRPKDSVSFACFCGGVVSREKYERWPISNWLNSFMKLDGLTWRKNRPPISVHEHASSFKSCVASNPSKFYDFVFGINSKAEIPEMYKVAGLEGLLAGGSDPYRLWILSKNYITEDFAQKNSYVFSQIVEYYIKEENEYLDYIIELCKSLSISPSFINYVQYGKNIDSCDVGSKTSELFNRAINSFQGRAAELLVHICAIETRRPMIYSFFTENGYLLQECIKTIPLYYLHIGEYYDKELYLTMLKSLLVHMDIDALFIKADMIQWCFYHRNDIVCNYINRIETNSLSHSLLAQIYFYGMIGTQNPKECEERLEKILSYNNEDVVAELVKAAMKSYEYADNRELSIKYLERFIEDGRPKVQNAFYLYSDSLPIEAFSWYCKLFEGCEKRKNRYFLRQLKYVERCVATHPVLCYKFISSLNYFEYEDGYLYNDEIVKILLEIYKKLSLDDNEDAVNEVLDLLDEYIFQNNRTVNDAISLIN